MSKFPLITAIMVTKGRLDLIAKSYACFAYQTYPNKELLIVNDGSEAVHAQLKKFTSKDKRVSILHVSGKTTLGELRNIGVNHGANLSIQWDDDDLYGPQRIAHQFKGLQDSSAVLLREQLHYFVDTNEVAWVVDPSGIEGTILFDKRCGLRYPAQARGEDTPLKHALQKKDLLRVVSGDISYCRVFHGSNTWERSHHLTRAKKLGRILSREKLIEAAKLYNWKNGWRFMHGNT